MKTLKENMLRFGTKNLNESNKQRLNEENVYDSLKRDKSPKNIARVIEDAYNTVNDDEAHVVAALQAIPTKSTSRVVNLVSKLLPGGIWDYLNSFMEGEFAIVYHNGGSVNSELARIYGIGQYDNVQPLTLLKQSKDWFAKAKSGLRKDLGMDGDAKFSNKGLTGRGEFATN